MLINACHKDNEHLQSEIEKLKKLSFKKEMVETSKEYLRNSSVNFDNKWYLFGFKYIKKLL